MILQKPLALAGLLLALLATGCGGVSQHPTTHRGATRRSPHRTMARRLADPTPAKATAQPREAPAAPLAISASRVPTHNLTQACEAEFARLPLAPGDRQKLDANCRNAAILPHNRFRDAVLSTCLSAVQEAVPEPLQGLERNACQHHPTHLYSAQAP